MKGLALAVARAMGIMPRLRAAASPVSQMTFVNSAGRAVARMGLKAPDEAGDLVVEIPRAELAAILLDAARDNAEILWNDTKAGLAERDGGV